MRPKTSSARSRRANFSAKRSSIISCAPASGSGASSRTRSPIGKRSANARSSDPMDITTLEMLREHYAEPKERAVRKEIRGLDVHCRRFIGLSPFLILATSDTNHNMDASPRGGAPGFVKVSGEGAVLIADAPGNNRLDSFANIIA